MDDFKSFKDEEGEKVDLWYGANFAKWINYRKFEDEDEDLKLPQIAHAAEKISKKAGIGIDFLIEETKYLVESIEQYVKALKKAGF